MKRFYILLFFLISAGCFSQSERSLEETKTYIVKMLNKHAYKQHAPSKRLDVEFQDNLLQVYILNQRGERKSDAKVYNPGTIYKYGKLKRLPGNAAHLTIWVDHIEKGRIRKRWVKTDLEFDVDNYDIAEQLIIALRHLNLLIRDAKPDVEKF